MAMILIAGGVLQRGCFDCFCFPSSPSLETRVEYRCHTPKDPTLPEDYHFCPTPETWGLSIDDGPTCAHTPLYDMLQQYNQLASLYYIGVNVLANPAEAQRGFNDHRKFGPTRINAKAVRLTIPGQMKFVCTREPLRNFCLFFSTLKLTFTIRSIPAGLIPVSFSFNLGCAIFKCPKQLAIELIGFVPNRHDNPHKRRGLCGTILYKEGHQGRYRLLTPMLAPTLR